MYRLSVGVGYSMFKLRIENPFSDALDFFNKIKQHRMILSPSIVRYYLENAPDAYSDILMTFIDDISNNDESSISFPDSNIDDAKQNIIDLVKLVPMRVLVSEAEEFKGYSLTKINLTTPESIVEHKNNAFNRYTFPIANMIATKGENCEVFSKWFGHLFENEDTITMIDSYFFNEDTFESFKIYYLPFIMRGANIVVYCANQYSSELIETKVNEELSNWNVSVYLSTSLHDRFILLSDLQISIGVGLNFMNPQGVVRKDCSISVTNDRIVPLPDNSKLVFESKCLDQSE